VQVARGEVLEVRWQATDVTQVYLSINGTPVATADAQQVNLNVETGDLSGEVHLLLEGVNGPVSDSQTAQVLVYEPMQVMNFSIAPPQLVRYVVQGLEVSWDVAQAVRTYITGLENFTTQTLTANGPTGWFKDVPGIPEEPLVVRLIAEDAFGNVLESEQTINVVNPECMPLAGPVTLYGGPGTVYQVVGSMPADSIVAVDGRDTSGGWIHLTDLAGDLSRWAQVDQLACRPDFQLRDLRIETNIPPTPIPTPTLTLTPTPAVVPTLVVTPTPVVIPTLVATATPTSTVTGSG
jgi:hypothetical protein